MKTKRLVQIGGVINLLFVLFHLFFWTMFDWPQSLMSLSPDNRAIMQVFNLHTAYTIAIFSILSFAYSSEISTSKLGRFIGRAIAGFWILRAVNQVVFWGMDMA